MTRIVSAMSFCTALLATSFFVEAAFAATEPSDACALLTPAQITSVMQTPYSPAVKTVAPLPSLNAETGTDCRYEGKKPLWFRIYYDGSAGDATTLFAKFKAIYGPNTDVPGLGDEAYFDKEGALHARKGNVRFYLALTTGEQQTALLKLGQIVAAQL
jgi:hypothetical protein